MKETLEEFKLRIKHPSDKKGTTYNVRNSWGVYDFYKFYRKNKPEGKQWVLTESQYFAIFRRVNECLVNLLIATGELEFPYRLGKIIIVKKDNTFFDRNGKMVIDRKIDWNKTLDFWYEDEEAYKNKTLLYSENPKLNVKYIRKNALFKNKGMYRFTASRDIARRVKSESAVSFIINRELSNQIKGLYDG